MHHHLVVLQFIRGELSSIGMIDLELGVGVEASNPSRDLHYANVITRIRDAHVVAHLRDKDPVETITTIRQNVSRRALYKIQDTKASIESLTCHHLGGLGTAATH